MFIPVGEFAPGVDGHPILYDKGTQARNTIPLESGYDGPIKHPASMSTTCTGTICGAFSANWTGAASQWFVAHADKISRIYSDTGTPTNVSAGLTISGDAEWSFCQFGGFVVAADISNSTRAVDLSATSSASFTALVGAPKAKYAATFEPGFVVLGYINDGALKPTSVRWSALNDHTNWPTTGTAAAAAVQSDEDEMEDGGVVTGVVGAVGGAAGAVFTERAVYRVEYVGPPAIFAFRQIDRQFGCVAPRSLVTVGGVAFYLSSQGFCSFDGQAVKLIGRGRVDALFFDDFAPTMPETLPDWGTVTAAVDPTRKIIVWAYPTSGQTTPNRWLVYNYAIDRWRYADRATVGADLLFTAGFGAHAALAGVRNNCVAIWSHPSFLPIACTVVTGLADAGPGTGRRVFVSGVRVLTDAATTGYTARIGAKETPSGAETLSTATAPGSDGVCPQRVSARYVAARVDISSSVDWSYLMGFDVTARPEGRR